MTIDSNEISRSGRPIEVRLTTSNIILIGTVFGLVLTAVIFVIRLNEKVDQSLRNQETMRVDIDSLRIRELRLEYQLRNLK